MAVAPVAGAVVANKMLRHGKYRESLPAMLGRRLAAEDPAPWSNGCIWVHGVSVGEVIAAKAMLPLLRQAYPHLPILLTTHTETGQAQACSLPKGMVDAVRYFPLDLSWIIRGFLKVYKPKMLVLMETELWPNTLNLTSEYGAQIFTLNGKISPRSFRGYSRFRSVFQKPLSRVTAFCVQTAGDGERLGQLIGRTDNIFVTGNCKFDAEITALTIDDKLRLRDTLQVPVDSPIIVAGSTHPGEEEIVLAAWRTVSASQPSAVLLLVPRHPERFSQVWDIVAKSGLPARRLSDGQLSGEGSPTVILIDKMGILTNLYSLATAALVAGSLVPGIGGHNILEPAAQSVPVLYGPHMFGQPDMVRILSEKSICTTAENLSENLLSVIVDREKATNLGKAGFEAWQQNRGSAQRNIDIIKQYTQCHDREH